MDEDFLPVRELFQKKLDEAREYLEKNFYPQFQMVEKNIKCIYICFIESAAGNTNIDERVVVFPPVGEETPFGEYALTPEYAKRMDMFELAGRLVIAAYLIHYIGEEKRPWNFAAEVIRLQREETHNLKEILPLEFETVCKTELIITN